MKKLLLLLCFEIVAITILAAPAKPSEKSFLRKKGNEFLRKKGSISFTENKGQIADQNGNPVPFVLFQASAPGVNIYLTEQGVSYKFIKKEKRERAQTKDGEENMKIQFSRVDMLLKGASIKKENIITEEPETFLKNYNLTSSPKGILNVRSFKKITVKNVYPLIDWVWYNAAGKGLKYDFVVHPGANPRSIVMAYKWADITTQNGNEQLRIHSHNGDLTEGKVISYSGQNPVSTHYAVAKNEVHFEVADYDTKSTLIIDPPLQLLWGTYFGGGDVDGFQDIKIDPVTGDVIIVGYSVHDSFMSYPTLQTWGSAYYDGTAGGNTPYGDALLLRFRSDGTLLWSTLFGGNIDEKATALALDASSNMYITGWTSSTTSFPKLSLSGAYYQAAKGAFSDAFIAKFDNSGGQLWTTFFGASGYDMGKDIAVDIAGNVFVTGATTSTDFPLQSLAGAYNQSAIGGGTDAFILEFNTGGSLLWSTYYGGVGIDIPYSIAFDTFSGNIYMAGSTASSDFPKKSIGGASYYDGTLGGTIDAFIAGFTGAGVQQWSTYYGGSSTDSLASVSTDAAGTVWAAGYTSSSAASFSLLTWPGAYNDATLGGSGDAFILQFDNTSTLKWATYLGGSGIETNAASGSAKIPFVMTDPITKDIYVTGATTSTNFPTQSLTGSYFQSANAGLGDVFITQFNSSGIMQWSTYSGTSQDDFGECAAVNASNEVYLIGEWWGAGSNGLLDAGTYYDGGYNGADDSFIMKFASSTPLPIELISFTGRNEGDKNLLEWTTASEMNSDYFIIERDKGQGTGEWEEIGKAKGAGNASATRNYSFLDREPSAGINYYRLKQTDYDGKFTYSNVVHITMKQFNSVTISPNPAKESLQITISGFLNFKTEINVRIYDVLGREVYNYQFLDPKSLLNLDVNALSKGMYFLKIANDGEQAQIKFVKE